MERKETFSEIEKNSLYTNIHTDIHKLRTVVSSQTQVAIIAKARVQEAMNSLFTIHDLLYDRSTCEEAYAEICKAAEPLEKLANQYLLESIQGNLDEFDSDEA